MVNFQKGKEVGHSHWKSTVGGLLEGSGKSTTVAKQYSIVMKCLLWWELSVGRMYQGFCLAGQKRQIEGLLL